MSTLTIPNTFTLTSDHRGNRILQRLLEVVPAGTVLERTHNPDGTTTYSAGGKPVLEVGPWAAATVGGERTIRVVGGSEKTSPVPKIVRP